MLYHPLYKPMHVHNKTFILQPRRLQKIAKFLWKTNVQKVSFTLQSQGSGERSGPNGPLVFIIISSSSGSSRSSIISIFISIYYYYYYYYY